MASPELGVRSSWKDRSKSFHGHSRCAAIPKHHVNAGRFHQTASRYPQETHALVT